MEPIEYHPMKTRNSSHQATVHQTHGAFTLVELLVVLTIVSILTAATIPAMQSVLQSTGVTQGGQSLVEQINLARQIASARNTTVYVNLIQTSQVQNGGYNAIQLWGTPSGQTTPIALSRLVVLPTSVVVSQDTTNYSKLLANAMVFSTSSPPPLAPPLPPGTVKYICFSVMPSGMIPVSSVATGEASEMTGAYLTLVPAGNGSTATAPGGSGAPKNYLIVQLNPNTGSTVVYRP